LGTDFENTGLLPASAKLAVKYRPSGIRNPNVSTLKKLISRKSLGYFSTLDLIQTFEQTFRLGVRNQFAYSTATFPSFQLAYQSRASKHKS